jgi:hypothetical protein
LITLERLAYLPFCTLGRLLAGSDAWATIERPWVNNEVSISCIPEGTYTCSKYSSRKFPRTYSVDNVVNRTHILFHIANSASEVSGCIGLGKGISFNEYKVVDSRVAMNEFIDYMGERESFDLKITQYHAVMT